ncbi:aldo/keto reductase [Curtobacterium sp. RRHDQ10]|uniref:aldo/keto reductase n=1 Tax=Curtobacterium phyllosphaerae TaxID=3413379 RepID=UPI003BEFC7BB
MMDATLAPLVELNDGHRMPSLGLGTYGLDGDEGTAAVGAGIDAGYRLLDTALNYGNEDAVGAAVRGSSVPRDQLFVTTKLPGRHHGYDEAHRSIEESLGNLGLEYVDLYLIHWPNPSVDKFVDTWKAFVDLRDSGVVRSIGVSNFTDAHLRRIVDATGVAPAVNQVELHPYFPQAAQRAVDASHGIVTESWSPLATQGTLMDEPVIADVAARHGVTPNQVVLRWHVQLGAVPVPKSGDRERQRENLDVFGFALTDDEMASISGLERGRLWGADPDTHEEM